MARPVAQGYAQGVQPPRRIGRSGSGLPKRGRNRMHKSVAILGLSFVMAFAGGAAAQDAQSWCKSKWGADDEKGAANHLNAQLALEAAKLVKTGKVYPLG